jgi:hypothetical protein
MRWITRERPRVGRIGCAWLIKGRIDPEAEFFFADGRTIHDEAERLGATIFHSEGAELSRQGSRSSFEVVIDAFGLAGDPALDLLAQIVNTADIAGSAFARPEGPGLKAILDGLLHLHADDHAVLAAGMAVYDALHAQCQVIVRRPPRP